MEIVSYMKNNTEKTKIKQKKTYIDVLMKRSRFTEFRYRPEFTEFIMRHFAAEAAAKCLQIKTKYKMIGKSLTPKRALDICLKEGMYIDVEPENRHGNSESWFAKNDDGIFILWINPSLELKQGQDLLIVGLATFLLTQYHNVHLKGESFSNLDELMQKPKELLRAVLTIETLDAMLLSNESEADLLALQAEPMTGTHNLARAKEG
jgi:hypothetical protein